MRQRRWLRRGWRVIVLAAVLAVLLAGFVQVFVPKPVAPYAIGALIASTAWWVYVLMLETGGIASKRSGITAEEWTADELRRLRREGWTVVNHVMLVHVDVDHVLLGPGGFLAIETKFRSDWGSSKQELVTMARTAYRSADDVASRLRRPTRDVQPLVVVWGPEVSTHFPDIAQHDGVTFCPGHRLREYIRALPERVEAAEVQIAFNHLDDYVKRRDGGEVAAAGPLPRTGSQMTNDVLALMVAVVASTMAVLSPAALPPEGAWNITTAAALLIAAVLVRRRWANSQRVQQVTTAVVTTCAGLGALLSVAAVMQALA